MFFMFNVFISVHVIFCYGAIDYFYLFVQLPRSGQWKNGKKWKTQWKNISSLYNRSDFVFVQEHSLIQANFFSDKIANVSCHGVSAMDTCQLLSGPPHGGCSILWKSTISCEISPVETTS